MQSEENIYFLQFLEHHVIVEFLSMNDSEEYILHPAYT